jgi:hypothetical protein
MPLDTVTFNGVPTKFVTVAKVLLKEWGELAKYVPPMYLEGNHDARARQEKALASGTASGQSLARVKSDTTDNLATIHFYLHSGQPHAEYEYGRIEAQIAPNDKSYLTMTFEDGHQDKMQVRWERMKRELIEQGWVKPPFATTEAVVHEWTPDDGAERLTDAIEEMNARERMKSIHQRLAGQKRHNNAAPAQGETPLTRGQFIAQEKRAIDMRTFEGILARLMI